MLRHSAALGLALLCASCDSAQDQQSATIAQQPVVAPDVHQPTWKPLVGPSEGLRFYVGAVDSERPRVPLGECVPLADGALLARFGFSPADFEGLICYVEIEAGELGLRPRAAGVFYGWCIGFGWAEALRGTVILDATDPAELLPSGHVFQREFRILPSVDSDSLRTAMRAYPEGPRLAEKR